MSHPQFHAQNHPQNQLLNPTLNQSFPPEVKIQPVAQVQQSHPPEFPVPQTPPPSVEMRSPTAGLVKMEPLPPNMSPTKMVAGGLEMTSRTEADGRSVFNIKRPSLSEPSSQGNSDDKPTEKKNVLLKQLLEQGSTGCPLPPSERKPSLGPSKSTTDDDDEQVCASLTPAQQQQLALIESMPLTMRKDSLTGSPVSLPTSEMVLPPPSESSVDADGNKKKKASKKKKKSAPEDVEMNVEEPPSEAVVNSLLERLRQCATVPMFEPDRKSLPPKCIFIKAETDAAPVPVGKKLEDLKKPFKRNLQGSFGQYELAAQGLKTRFYVGVGAVNDETAAVPAEISSDVIFEECTKVKNWDIPFLMKHDTEIKTEMNLEKGPMSPALTYVSSSSYGETRLLEPCYDHMYNWLEISFPPDGPPVTDIFINEPTLQPTLDPGTPNSVKENYMEMTKTDMIVSSKAGRLLKDSDRVNVTMTITDEAAA